LPKQTFWKRLLRLLKIYIFIDLTIALSSVGGVRCLVLTNSILLLKYFKHQFTLLHLRIMKNNFIFYIIYIRALKEASH